MLIRVATLWFVLVSSVAVAEGPSRPLDLVPCGHLLSWSNPEVPDVTEVKTVADLPKDGRAVGVQWDEDRDVCEIRATFANPITATAATVQYWCNIWPPKAPTMPTMEDPMDDPWQGRWVEARVKHTFENGVDRFTFEPLEKAENLGADNLPGVTYRRTLKVRLVLPAGSPKLESLQMHSESMLKPLAVRIEFGCGDEAPAIWSGHLEIFNGELLSAQPWNFESGDTFQPPFAWKQVRSTRSKGVVAQLLASVPSPPGSNDITVVTVRATATTAAGEAPRTFSFSTLDLERGPIYVPAMHAFVVKDDDPRHFGSEKPQGKTIRQQIPSEPEQTFERASREIPPLDPWVRQQGDQMYLPVAVDAHWQKFLVEYGGDILLGNRHIKPPQRRRLQWPGEYLTYRVGTLRVGQATEPYWREDHQATAAIAEDCLPIVLNRWQRDGLDYEQESFATLLRGPLDPNDPARNEQTPAILMLRLRVHNPGPEAARARCVLRVQPREELKPLPKESVTCQGQRIYRQSDPRCLRMVLAPPAEAMTRDAQGDVACEFAVPAGGTETLRWCIPAVSDLDDADAAEIAALDYDAQRTRVADYWRAMIARAACLQTPEPEFNHLARALVPRIHLSVTKDPKSGLYMVPAASYRYQVYLNESCFQTMFLDVLGDHGRAEQYLKTATDLQGSRSFPGNYAEPHDGVYHGAKVDEENDYTASRYGLDHGTVLWALAKHYRYTRDAQWLQKNLPSMFRAVQWIQRQRALTRKTDLQGNRVLEYGLLAAGHLEDNHDWGYWFAVNAYCVAGMLEMADALADIAHPEAKPLQEEARAYRDDLRTAVLRSTELAPVTRMRDGTYAPYVPTRAYQRFRYFGPLRVQYYSRYQMPDVLPCYRASATREVLYGPMILLTLPIFDAQEPLADWVLDDWEDNLTLSSSGGFNVHGFTDDRYWFSQGGMVFQANLQNPILPYLWRQEIPAALRTLYNGFVSCLYPEVHTLTEEYREWRHASGPFYKVPDETRVVNRVRDLLVLESGDELRLAAGVPRRWLASKEGIRVERVGSYFGPLGFTLRAGDAPKTVVATVDPPTRNQPRHLWLYVRLPEPAKLASVTIDGQAWTKFDPAQERIELPQTGRPLAITIGYE